VSQAVRKNLALARPPQPERTIHEEADSPFRQADRSQVHEEIGWRRPGHSPPITLKGG
jgi:hypothetical protein